MPRVKPIITLAVLLVSVVGFSGGLVMNEPHQVAGPRAVRAAGPDAWARMPVGLRAEASAVIGASQPAWRAVKRDGRLVASGGGVRSSFDREGVSLRVASGSARLVLAGVGRRRRLMAVMSAAPVAWRNSVTYRRGGVVEWYRSGPLGLEQGFTLNHRTAGRSGEVAIGLRVGGSLRAGLAHGDVVFLTRSGRVALRYGRLSAVDGAGRRLPARIELRGALLTLHVRDLGARYPVRIDPFVQQGAKLTPSDSTVGAFEVAFGGSVALSADGNTALIGGNGDNGGSGAAWVFVRSGGVWTQEGHKLTASDENGAGRFGDSVALSADGNTALIGGNGDNSFVGAAWVFTFGLVGNHVGWLQQGSKLTASDENGVGRFGDSVALSADGNTALIGGGSDDSNTGAAWVFVKRLPVPVWTQQGSELTASDEANPGAFGGSVALSADGNTALIGGYSDNSNTGAAWVFARSGGVWTQQGPKLTPRDETGIVFGIGGFFGAAVALSADGKGALIGGYGDNRGVGAAWVFARPRGVWTQQGSKLTASDETDAGGFGASVAVSADGNAALIGGEFDHGNVGAAWGFVRRLPVVVTAPASAVGQTAATLSGSVNPEGPVVSDCHFDWGTSGAYGNSVACSPTPGSGTDAVAVAATLSGLAPGTTYHFRAVATTTAGTSYGADQNFTTPAVPGPPTGLLTDAGDGQATVAFTAPAANGSPITAYTVTASPGGAHATGPGSPITVGGLRNGTTYTFTVTATNALGTGPPSAPSNPVTPTGPVVVGAPALSGLRLSPAAFRAAPGGPTALAAARNRTQTGTLVSYADSQAATTTFTVLQPQSGVRHGNRCVKPPQYPRRGAQPRRCTRLVGLGSFTHIDRAGQNRLRFTGHISGRKLKPGLYQLRALARNPAGNTSPPITTHFQITR